MIERGTIKALKDRFGFIRPDRGKTDVYFAFRSFRSFFISSLNVGDRVVFVPTTGAKGVSVLPEAMMREVDYDAMVAEYSRLLQGEYTNGVTYRIEKGLVGAVDEDIVVTVKPTPTSLISKFEPSLTAYPLNEVAFVFGQLQNSIERARQQAQDLAYARLAQTILDGITIGAAVQTSWYRAEGLQSERFDVLSFDGGIYRVGYDIWSGTDDDELGDRIYEFMDLTPEDLSLRLNGFKLLSEFKGKDLL